MSYKPYPKYKPSGVDWIGEIPAGWNTCIFKRELEKVKDGTHGSFSRVANGRPFLSAKNVQNGFIKLGETESLISEEDYQEIVGTGFPQRGDILLTIVGTIGRSCVYEFDEPLAFQRSTAFLRLRETAYPYFYFYFTQSKFFQNALTSVAKTSAQSGVYLSDLAQTEITVPPFVEQTQIATFLDRKTTQIDKLIEIKRKQIELLKEERTAIINQAVTKGLNPDAKMKESGIEWIGQIPEGWKIKKLKRVVSDMVSGPFGSALKKEEYSTEGYRVYGQEQVIPANFKIGNYYIPSKKYQSLERYSVSPGDILVSCVGTFGKIAVVPDDIEPGVINPRLIRLEPDQAKILPHYIEQLLSSTMIFRQFEQVSRGGTMGVINLGLLSELILPIPPLKEQPELLAEIKAIDSKNNEAMKLANQQINLLKEYRTTLISDAVTGKIDIREEAA